MPNEARESCTEEEEWRYSKTKKMLEKDIIDGKIGSIANGMKPKDVHSMRSEYKKIPYKLFVSRLYTLRKKYEELQKNAEADAAALSHDLALNIRVNSKPYPRWQGSEAERLLKEDVDSGWHMLMYPRDLQESHPAYAPFPGKVFSDHIQQEARARRERPYWLARRKEKEEEKAKKKAAKKASKKAPKSG